jgi:hypothetical protein
LFSYFYWFLIVACKFQFYGIVFSFFESSLGRTGVGAGAIGYGEMEIKEIAKMLHIPEGTVKSRLNSAKADIKQKMEEQGYEGY